MKSITQVQASLTNCFDWDLIKTVGPHFLILIGIFNFIPSPFFNLIYFITAQFFTVILLTAFRAKYENTFFSLPNRNLFLIKAWKVFCAIFVSAIFTLLGLCLFIVPGIFLAKRYLYAGVIAERELLGPIDSMAKSKELSELNGWLTLRAVIYNSLFIALAAGVVAVIFSIPSEMVRSHFFFGLIFDWITTVAGCSILFLGYKEATQAMSIPNS